MTEAVFRVGTNLIVMVPDELSSEIAAGCVPNRSLGAQEIEQSQTSPHAAECLVHLDVGFIGFYEAETVDHDTFVHAIVHGTLNPPKYDSGVRVDNKKSVSAQNALSVSSSRAA